MLFLPHSTDLKLAQRPYVTYAVILICIVVFLLQEQNRGVVWEATQPYCELINDSNDGKSVDGLVDLVPRLEQRELDVLRGNEVRCRMALNGWHAQPNKGNIERMVRQRFDGFAEEEMTVVVAQAQAHYEAFATHAPSSLDERLLYDPATPNPIRMLTSSLAHADWWHIGFNLMFFFAFAPALELMCLHWLRYVAVLVSISVVTSVSYSLFSIGSMPIPTLGLSGVVMGMIGLSAYMMPRARIRTFVWVLHFARNIYIPAWILALFYIGSDLITLFEQGNNSGVNLVAHVSGGISGYLIGYFWLKKFKQEIQEQLEEEMLHRDAVRNDIIGNGSTSRAGQQRIVQQRQEYEAKREYQAWLDRLHTLVSTAQDSDAIALLLEESDRYTEHPELYDQLFSEVLKWRAGRAALCLGRWNITLLLQGGKKARALAVLRSCMAITPEFVLADPKQNGVLLKQAMASDEYELAYHLLHRAAERYGEYVDAARYRLMEAQLLVQHLGRYDEAKSLLSGVLAEAGNPYREQAEKLMAFTERLV